MSDDRGCMRTLCGVIPKPLSRFCGFAFLQCWILAMFSSPVPYGNNSAGLSLEWLHCLASLASILTALAVLMFTPRLRPLSRRKELGLLLACAGAVGSLGVSLASDGIAPAWCGLLGMMAVAVCATWLYLSWQEYYSTQGAQVAVFGFALATIAGALLFFILGFAARSAGVAAGVLLLFLAEITLRPHRGARFYSRTETTLTARELCIDIAHDWSPRLMTIVSLVALVYGVLRSISVPLHDVSGAELWVRFGGSLSAASVVACFVVLSAHKRSIMKAFYVALPLSAFGVIAYALPFGSHAEAAVFLGSCGFSLVNYLVWIVMLEKAFSRKLPVVGLLASLWSASYVGVLVGQLLAAFWPFGWEYLNYALLLLLIAASLLLVSMNGKLTVSRAALEAPEVDPVAQRALEIAEMAKLSPRETEILVIWLAGHNAAYIEETLHISRNTVKTHLKHIYQKTGVESKEELLKLGKRD